MAPESIAFVIMTAQEKGTNLASQLSVTSELSMQMVSLEVLLYRMSGASTTYSKYSSCLFGT